MKFYKRITPDTKNPMDKRFSVEADDRIETNTKVSLQLPKGTTGDRPAVPKNGMIRYNNDLGPGGDIEVFTGTSWERIKTVRQSAITQQIFYNGNYLDTLFGPLSYDVDTTAPQNVFVYVENVPQIANLNYTLVSSTLSTPYLTTSTVVGTVPAFTTTITLSSVADFRSGSPVFGANIDPNAVIVSSSSTTQSIEISIPTTGVLTSGTSVIAQLNTGTYVKFSDDSVPVPTKPVTTLMGFDGYSPPFPA